MLNTAFNQPKRKILISVFTACLVAVGLLILIIWPSLARVRELSNQIYSQRLELEKIYLRGKTLKQTLEQYQAIKPSLGVLNDLYLKEGQELELITSLERLADAQRVDQNLKLATSETKPTTPRSLPLQLTVNSSFPQLVNYLADLEQLNYFLNISSVRISSASRLTPGQPKTGTITALLLANGYYQP